MRIDPADYGTFASTITREIQPPDVVFVHKAWYETPILYYLNPDTYDVVGRDYALALESRGQARVWVVLLYDAQLSAAMQNALVSYNEARRIRVGASQAILFERGSTGHSPKVAETELRN